MSLNKEILTPEEVQEYLHIKQRTLYRWINEETIPAFKLGGSWRFKKSEIDEWINKKRNSKFKQDS